MGILSLLGFKDDEVLEGRLLAAKGLCMVAEHGKKTMLINYDERDVKYKETFDALKEAIENLCGVSSPALKDGQIVGKINAEIKDPKIGFEKPGSLSPAEFVALYPELKEPFAKVAAMVKVKKAEAEEAKKPKPESKKNDVIAAVTEAVIKAVMQNIDISDSEAAAAKMDMGRPKKDKDKKDTTVNPAPTATEAAKNNPKEEPVNNPEPGKQETAKPPTPTAEVNTEAVPAEPAKTDNPKKDKTVNAETADKQKSATESAPKSETAKPTVTTEDPNKSKVSPVITDAIRVENQEATPTQQTNAQPAATTAPVQPTTTEADKSAEKKGDAKNKSAEAKKPVAEESREEVYVPKNFRLDYGINAGMKVNQFPIFNRMVKKLDRQTAFIKKYPGLVFTDLIVHITNGDKKYAMYVLKDMKGLFVEVFYNTGVTDNKKNISINTYDTEKQMLDVIKMRETAIAAEKDETKKAELMKLLYHIPKAA